MPKKHHRSENGWNEATVELMLSLKASAGILAYKYDYASQWYYTAHNVISIPMIIIMSIVGSATFTTLSDDCSGDVVWKVIAGSITILAAIMTAVSNFLDFRGKSVLCKSSHTGFKTMENEILRMLLLKPGDRVPYSQFSQDMFNLYNKLYSDAPTLVSYFNKKEGHEHHSNSPLDMDSYCVYVQKNPTSKSKSTDDIGGGLSFSAQSGEKLSNEARVRLANTKFSTVGIESLGSRQLHEMMTAAYSEGSDSPVDAPQVEVRIE